MTDQPTPQQVTAFWMQVERRGDHECWIWQGYVEKGYGRVFLDGRMVGAHEMALTLTTGERRLEHLDTCHSCHTPRCCNPAHLRFDTRQSNVDDMIRAGRDRKASKLSAEDVGTIRARLAAGAKQKDLAQQYGVNNSLISMIKNGKRWAA